LSEEVKVRKAVFPFILGVSLAIFGGAPGSVAQPSSAGVARAEEAASPPTAAEVAEINQAFQALLKSDAAMRRLEPHDRDQYYKNNYLSFRRDVSAGKITEIAYLIPVYSPGAKVKAFIAFVYKPGNSDERYVLTFIRGANGAFRAVSLGNSIS
jgi:hypothetical protein